MQIESRKFPLARIYKSGLSLNNFLLRLSNFCPTKNFASRASPVNLFACFTFRSFDSIAHFRTENPEIVIVNVKLRVYMSNHSIGHHPQIIIDDLSSRIE